MVSIGFKGFFFLNTTMAKQNNLRTQYVCYKLVSLRKAVDFSTLDAVAQLLFVTALKKEKKHL